MNLLVINQSYLTTSLNSLCYSLNNLVAGKNEYDTKEQMQVQGILYNTRDFHKKDVSSQGINIFEA